MAKICPIFSGSAANCTYIGYSGGAVLVDAGASFSAIKNALLNNGLDICELKAIFITHTHSDHIKGLKPLLKALKIPVVASRDTLIYLEYKELIPEGVEKIEISGELSVGGITVTYFKTGHDCLGSGGYSFLLPEAGKVSVCTDLGVMTDEVKAAITGSNILLIESNHDVKMLKNGPYPPELKLRILGDMGHLSNNICAATLKELFLLGTNKFVLMHLSRHNNTPLLAAAAATGALLDLGAERDKDYKLWVAAPEGNEVIYI